MDRFKSEAHVIKLIETWNFKFFSIIKRNLFNFFLIFKEVYLISESTSEKFE